MSLSASKRLISLAEKNQPASSHGISLDDVAKIHLTDDIKTDILTCLYDVDPTENFWGVWFCEGLVSAGKLDSKLAAALVQQLPSLAKAPNPQIRAELIPILVMLPDLFPKFRGWMMQFLRDDSPSVRQARLMNSHTFLGQTEISPLIPFKDDPYV